MARGWESKAIEEQQAEAARTTERAAFTPLAPTELARRQRRESLLLVRSHLSHQLQHARSDAQRQRLEQALAALDQEIE
jgi:hypothetical protein